MDEPTEETAEESKSPASAKHTKQRRAWQRPLQAIILTIIAVFTVSAGAMYALTPSAIRKPQMEHLHFRMQVIIDGKAVDFSRMPFQAPYSKGQCSGDLPTEPIHFHDQKDQFVHVHWKHMTGGLVLKNYGWNFIGGLDSTLGYRFDDLPKITRVPIHTDGLPDVPMGAKFWVYTGDEQGHKERSFDDFTKQGLEQFFDAKSNFLTYDSTGKGLLAWFFPHAVAHEGHTHDTTTVESDEERLTRINNLLGNVVIFVQKDKPSDQQIKDRFAHLEPLSDSTCGG